MAKESFKNGAPWNYLSKDSVVYQGENDETPYTKQELIDLCKGNKETARRLFELLEWQSPSTLLDEWFREGEIDEDFNFINQDEERGKGKVPLCLCNNCGKLLIDTNPRPDQKLFEIVDNSMQHDNSLQELFIGEDEDGGYKGCPDCKTDGYLMDFEGEIEEVYDHTEESIEYWKYVPKSATPK